MKQALLRSSLALVPAVILAVGCGRAHKMFRVASYPAGASIFVDGVERGQTDFGKLLVDFEASPSAVLRIEKEGFQTTGVVLYPETSEHLTFFLSKEPQAEKTLRKLEGLESRLEEISNRVNELQSD